MTTTPPFKKLSRQEQRVLQYLADGLKKPEIAAEMGLALGTVTKYAKHCKWKMVAKTEKEAIEQARALGQIQ